MGLWSSQEADVAKVKEQESKQKKMSSENQEMGQRQDWYTSGEAMLAFMKTLAFNLSEKGGHCRVLAQE